MQPYIDHGAFFWVTVMTRLAVLVLIVVGVVLLVRWLSSRYPAGGHYHAHGGGPVQPPPSGAMQILEERFARGEIDEAEFKSRKDALRS